MFTATLFTRVKTLKQPLCPLTDDEWIKKMCVLFSYNKGRNIDICDNMDGPDGHYAKSN